MFGKLKEATSSAANHKTANILTPHLEPSGKFNIDFECDQALTDEIERLNNE